jgi:hypothetical protein
MASVGWGNFGALLNCLGDNLLKIDPILFKKPGVPNFSLGVSIVTPSIRLLTFSDCVVKIINQIKKVYSSKFYSETLGGSI